MHTRTRSHVEAFSDNLPSDGGDEKDDSPNRKRRSRRSARKVHSELSTKISATAPVATAPVATAPVATALATTATKVSIPLPGSKVRIWYGDVTTKAEIFDATVIATSGNEAVRVLYRSDQMSQPLTHDQWNERFVENGWKIGRRLIRGSDTDLRALLPKLAAWNLPAPNKKQQLERKRLHLENLAIAKQQAKNRLVPTKKFWRAGYEVEMEIMIKLSGKGTRENNPFKTRTAREAQEALRAEKADRAASTSAKTSAMYDSLLNRLFTDVNKKKFRHVPNRDWLIENNRAPPSGYSPFYRPFTRLDGERLTRPVPSILLEYRLEVGCSCGVTNPVCLDNSHLDSDDKTRRPGRHQSGSVFHNVLTIAAAKLEQSKMKVECANCHQKASAVERRRTKMPYHELAYPHKQMYRDKLNARIAELKEMSSCAICHLRDPDCLLIEHSNRWGKRWSISWMISNQCDWIDILEEMENGECCVMCHNCHAIKGFVEGESC